MLPLALDTSAGEYEEVRSVIARLPACPLAWCQRLVLFLRYYADLDYGTIAEALATLGDLDLLLNLDEPATKGWLRGAQDGQRVRALSAACDVHRAPLGRGLERASCDVDDVRGQATGSAWRASFLDGL
jgi:hypothetical protein